MYQKRTFDMGNNKLWNGSAYDQVGLLEFASDQVGLLGFASGFGMLVLASGFGKIVLDKKHVSGVICTQQKVA